MGQNITLKIGNMDYPFVANSPEQEQVMRLAAEEINSMLARFDVQYPTRTLVDKLAFAALQSAVGKISGRSKVKALSDEIDCLQTELDAYLKDK